MLLESSISQTHRLEIIYPTNQKLARKPIHRGQLQERTKIRSLKSAAELVKGESPSEKIYSQILECSPWIDFIQEQPAIIKYFCEYEQCIKTHFPDLLLRSTNSAKPTFVEIKTNLKEVTAELLSRTKQMSYQLQFLGYKYRLMILENIPKLLIENCRTVLRFSRFVHLRDPNLYLFCEANHKKKFWGEFDMNERTLICHLLRKGDIAMDLLSPINVDTAIEWEKPIYGSELWHKYV